MKYVIEGGKKLEGEVKISGNKNSILPCMAAALLTSEEVILENVPEISDVLVFTEILKHLGSEVKKEEHRLIIKSREIKEAKLPEDLMEKVRASLMFVGALLSRQGEAHFTHPGGDVIGKRSIDVHLEGLKDLGIKIIEDGGGFRAVNQAKETAKNLEIFLSEPSQTGTSNLLLSSVIGNRVVRLRNCAKEPSNIDLCKMLISMGAQIEGVGTDTLTIKGVENLAGTTFRVSDDFAEIGTYAIAAAITGGHIRLIYHPTTDILPIFSVFREFGVDFEFSPYGAEVKADKLRGVDVVKTNVWPGFPTDLMSVLIVLATQSEGVTLCHDWMYESRMFFTDKLLAMGAKIIIADPHRVLVYGPRKLRGKELETPDIRAGMALVLAALAAEGRSVINRAELIERGYEDVLGKLSKLGANVKRVQ